MSWHAGLPTSSRQANSARKLARINQQVGSIEYQDEPGAPPGSLLASLYPVGCVTVTHCCLLLSLHQVSLHVHQVVVRTPRRKPGCNGKLPRIDRRLSSNGSAYPLKTILGYSSTACAESMIASQCTHLHTSTCRAIPSGSALAPGGAGGCRSTDV
jgi:hypothetical protein